jgi:hypothetical protein
MAYDILPALHGRAVPNGTRHHISRNVLVEHGFGLVALVRVKVAVPPDLFEVEASVLVPKRTLRVEMSP